jgi:hypothetical protein
MLYRFGTNRQCRLSELRFRLCQGPEAVGGKGVRARDFFAVNSDHRRHVMTVYLLVRNQR